MENEKPMLSVEEQIEHLASKGVKFNIVSKDDATEYLYKNNNYFKLRAYRKNFSKHPGGINKGKYIDLDFAQLKDLAIIDMRMRYTFIQMSLDIEHYAKIKLLHEIENSDDDGYQIVKDYYDYLIQYDFEKGTSHYPTLIRDLERNDNNPYCGGIIEKYREKYPVWAFMEIIPLGSMIHFYGFCADQLNNKSMKDDYYLLKTIKELRNAAAHSNCIIINMGAKTAKHSPNYNVVRSLKEISKAKNDIQLKNECMRQIVTLLYTHSNLVTSEGVHLHTKSMLKELCERMFKNIDMYSNNSNIIKSFEYFKKCVDILF